MSTRKKRAPSDAAATAVSPKAPARRRRPAIETPVTAADRDDFDGDANVDDLAPASIAPASEFVFRSPETAAEAGGDNVATVVASAARPSAAAGEPTTSIDELLLRAATRRQTGAQPEAPVTTSAGAVLDTTPATQIRTVDEFVERVLNLTSVERAPDEFRNNPFIVTGLSQDEPNPDWTCLQDERAALEQRATRLERDRQALLDMQRRGGEPDLALRDVLLRRSANYYEPIDAIKLIKPASIVRRISEHWRGMLGGVLRNINERFSGETKRLLLEVARAAADPVPAATAAQIDLRVRTYVPYVVNPVLNDAFRQLQSATYEDMPLTQELLRELFDEFFTRLLDTLLEQPEAAQQQADEAAEVPLEEAPALAERVDVLLQQAIGSMAPTPIEQLQSIVESEERELYERLRYLRQAVYVYANSTYEAYFVRWRVGALVRLQQVRNAPILLASLERVLHNMIQARRQSAERSGQVHMGAPLYVAPTDRATTDLFELFITKKIALQRARALLEQDAGTELQRAFAAALEAPAAAAAPTDYVAVKLLVRPRFDRFLLLETAYKIRAAQITERYGDADPDAAAAELARLQLNNAALNQLLLDWSPITAPLLREHGPDDSVHADLADSAADPYWSPFNLAYPLSIDATNQQLEPLNGFVSSHAEIFDADALHQSANSLRSILTVGYADQLVQRELQRIEFALRELVRPTRAVPLDVALPVDAPTAFELHTHLSLRPELEFVLVAPTAALRDPVVVQLADDFSGIDFDAVWWFQPTLDPDTGHVAGGIEPRVIARQRMVRNGVRSRTSTLRISGVGAQRAGLYWTEVLVADADGDRGLRSKFTARVRVTALCARDGAVYELGTEHFGQCTWSEHARSSALAALVDEWRVLVERGPASHKRLLDQRRFDALVTAQAGGSGADALLYLPPWGDDGETSLLGALPALLDDDAPFVYEAVLSRVLHRIGAQLRGLPGATAATALAATRSDLDLLLLLSDETIDETAGEWFVLQTLFAELAASGAFLEPAARTRDSRPPAPPGSFNRFATLAERVADARRRRNALTNVQRSNDFLLSDSLPPWAMSIPRFSTERPAQSVARVPLPTVLYLLSAPLVWLNLAWRERRFFGQVRAGFDRVAATLSKQWSSELLGSAYACDQSWWRVRDLADGPAALQAEVWYRLAGVTADSLRVDVAEATDMLFDRTLRQEFDTLVESRLVRTGLVSVYEHTVRDQRTGMLRVRRTIASAPETGLSSLFRANPSSNQTRLTWIDAHTNETNQPSVYRIAVNRASGASVVQRGSEPCGKYYDFPGLHAIISMLAARYTLRAKALADDNAADDELGEMEQQLLDLELLYNYLAFVAEIPHNRQVIAATQLLALLKTKGDRNFFAQVRQQRAANNNNNIALWVQT